MSIGKRLLTLLFLVVLTGAVSVNAYAHDVPDMSEKGIIDITMKWEDQAVPGGTLTLYRVGAVREDDGDFSFEPTGVFKNRGSTFEDIQSAGLAAELARYAADNDLQGTTRTIGKDGKISFANLELGLYLVVQEQAASGYSKINPFLVSVPAMEEGEYIYSIDASPKITNGPEPVPVEPSSPAPAKPGTTLPWTGQLTWPIPILVVAGLLLFSLGWVLCFGKKKSRL